MNLMGAHSSPVAPTLTPRRLSDESPSSTRKRRPRRAPPSAPPPRLTRTRSPAPAASERPHKDAQFRDVDKRLDKLDFRFNARMNRNLVFELATANWVGARKASLSRPPPARRETPPTPSHTPSDIPAISRVLSRRPHSALGTIRPWTRSTARTNDAADRRPPSRIHPPPRRASARSPRPPPNTGSPSAFTPTTVPASLPPQTYRSLAQTSRSAPRSLPPHRLTAPSSPGRPERPPQLQNQNRQ